MPTCTARVCFEALNLFQTEWKAINDDAHYSVGSDSLLEEALKEGREKT